jgi:hypothetical protein
MKNLILIVVVTILFSCSNPVEFNSKGVISADEMVKILTSRQLVVSELNTFQYQGSFSENHVDSLLASSYVSLGYSEEDFKTSWDYYTSNGSEDLLLIYDKVLQELQLLEEKSKN